MKKEETEGKTYKVRHPYNYVVSKGQTTTGLSRTIPQQAIGLREIMDRFTKGLPVSAPAYDPIWEDEPSNGINPATLDYADIEQMKIKNADNIQNLNNQAKEEDRRNKEERQRKQKEANEAEEKRLLELFKRSQ